MQTADVAVATITWARSPQEEQVLAAALRCLANAGMPVAVADRGASVAFTELLRGLRGFRICVPSGGGLVSQIQASMNAAAEFGRRFILYVEPDKRFFFTHRMNDFLRQLPDHDRVGVAIASRSAESFATFPPTQRYTEGVINQLCGDIIGSVGDYSYGPFVLSRTLLSHVASLDDDLGWGWRHSTFIAAHRAGLDVLHVTGNYSCPPEQQHEGDEERIHRMRQLSQNIIGLLT
jgi:hypothetical protein